ncbi:MAG: radical SAM protein [Candidatus Omnitrophota bacterium]
MAFRHEEILFSPTARCNLACPHCNSPRSHTSLPVTVAEKFLIDCKKNGVKRLGFTGGEPFLRSDFLISITRLAVKEGFLFSRIVTNGVWYKDARDLECKLKKLFDAGYDGSICLSVDAYHRQNLRKLAVFIKCAIRIWRRPDIVSLVYVTGQDALTKRKLEGLAKLLGARLVGFGTTHPRISSEGLFLKIDSIELSPVGRAGRLKDPWDGKWFKDDMCKEPGNVFFV